jgi:Integrase zinc binding domain
LAIDGKKTPSILSLNSPKGAFSQEEINQRFSFGFCMSFAQKWWLSEWQPYSVWLIYVHFGFDKSYESLHGSYYWPNMCWDLENAYIPSCTECQWNKNCTSEPTGPLHPLPVPDDWFDTIALDFIGPLPEEDGKDTILTMTDLLGADICIAGIHSTYTAAQVTVILFDGWYCENGLMLHLISDQDAQFTAELWTALHKLTSVKLKMSTSYHPETAGSSEQSNKTMNQAIWYHVDNNQKGWLAKLPHVWFAIMNSTNASTGFSGFQLKTSWWYDPTKLWMWK